MKHAWLLLSGALLYGGSEAAAQSAYVGASVFGDIVRVSGSRTYGSGDASTGGEAIGFTIRLGGVITDRWGVEAEFARPSEIEIDDQPEVYPLTRPTFSEIPGLGVPSLPLIFPPIQYRSTFRNTTISTSAWVRQDLTDNSSLVYQGGLSFYRSEHSFEYVFDPRLLITIPAGLPAPSGLSLVPYLSESVFYGVKPFVGVEGRIGLGERVQFVPGLRLHAVENAWLVRPAVGLNWIF
jgi:hypothetical protein